jgi:hypothetical protein
MGVTAGGAAAEGAKDAGEAEAGKGAAEAGTTAALAGGGADALTAGVADAGLDAGLAAGAGDATADLATTAGGLGAADTSAGLAAAGDAAGVAGGAGASTAALASGPIPELTVTGAAPTAGAGASSAITPIAASGLAAAGAGGGGSGVPGSTQAGVNGPESGSADTALANSGAPSSADISSATSGIGDISTGDLSSGGFLPATADSSVQSLSPDLMQSLGIDTGNIQAGVDPSLAATPDMPGVAPESFGDQVGDKASEFGKWLESPKNAATAGLLGLSAKNALTTPKLSAASQAAEANAAAEAKGALPVIQSGGTASPEWGSQKASIDATVDNQIKQQTQAIMQAAASSGEGGQNSGIVQQQIAAMTQQANLQRQQLYSQAQAQNVQQAVSEISGGDSTLTTIGNTQLQQSQEAQQLASQTAEMALLLQTGQKLPGQGTGAGPTNAGS